MYFVWLTFTYFTLPLIIPVASSESSYLLKLQQLRKAAAEEQPQHETAHTARNAKSKGTNNDKKVNRYKCILMDDDEKVLMDGSFNSEHSFIKVIPQEDEEKFKIMNSPSFASEVGRTTQGKTFDELEGDLIYLTSTTPLPLNSPLAIKKLNNGNSRSQESVRKNDSNQKAIPVAHIIPLRNALDGGQDSLRHVETPRHEQQTIINTAEEHLYQQSTRRRFISDPITTTPSLPKNANNNYNQQLKLGEQHCKMITHYASLYNVKDIKEWVHHNCAFAKMYLPNATCAEIDILVASCFD